MLLASIAIRQTESLKYVLRRNKKKTPREALLDCIQNQSRQPLSRENFRKYLQVYEYGAESLDFYLSSPSTGIEEFIDRFLRAGARDEINIDESMRRRTIRDLRAGSSTALLAPRLVVLDLLEPSFLRFMAVLRDNALL